MRLEGRHVFLRQQGWLAPYLCHKVGSLELRLPYRDYPSTSMQSSSLVCLSFPASEPILRLRTGIHNVAGFRLTHICSSLVPPHPHPIPVPCKLTCSVLGTERTHILLYTLGARESDNKSSEQTPRGGSKKDDPSWLQAHSPFPTLLALSGLISSPVSEGCPSRPWLPGALTKSRQTHPPNPVTTYLLTGLPVDTEGPAFTQLPSVFCTHHPARGTVSRTG